MENPEPERSSAPEEGGSLNRNRSFKSKQLVRSQAIRESQSPPRAASPADAGAAGAGAPAEEEREEKRRPVEIQITGGSWEGPEQRARRRWPPQRDLLSNAPRVACVAGCRHSEQHCRGPRRRQTCPTKQDSGISCPDDCADCSDFEHTGGSSNDVRKACSLDSDEAYCRCPDRRDIKPKNNSLNRAESADVDKLEPSGPELVKFIKETLNKNARDRMTLLKIEKELHALVTDTGRCIVKFPVMTSYGRMLVHRAAALFQLTHHLDQATKNSVTWCTVNFPPSPVRHQDSVNAKSILKRDTHSPDDSGSNCRAVERSNRIAAVKTSPNGRG
ncbi:hypothetical protein MSG28_012525 [Choristoneura fumiferana]|uniref:Uncharacterized protein n=1 Tax=Choristoneura fumiferana TaxID=7141 RepID=A0ACC0KDG8_CHOFU|nr:hypothetical protein MSG28_012525 [Choristoneura fumiferana]